MNQKMKTVNGHGFFRKSKAYGLVCGIALFGAMVTTSVSAEEIVTETSPAVEVVNPNPATNLETVQEAASAESLATQAETGQKTGELTSPVTSTELDKVVTDAKEAGVAVTEDSKAIVYDNLDQAQADLAKQAEAVKEATVKQEDNTEAIKKAEAHNAEIDRQNKVEADRIARENAEIDHQNKAGQARVDQQNKEEQERVDKENARLTAEYEADLANIADVEAYNEEVRKRNAEAIAEVDKENARRRKEFEDKLAEYEAKGKLAENKEVDTMLVGHVNEGQTGRDYYSNLIAIYKGNDKSVRAVEHLGFKEGLTTVTDGKGLVISNYVDGTPNGVVITSAVKGMYVLSDVSEGDSFTLNNLGKTSKGETIHACVIVSKVEKNNDDASYFTIGYQDEGNEYNALGIDYYNFSRIGLEFQFVDDADQPLNLFSAFIVGDVDYRQSAQVSYGYEGSTTFVSPESHLEETEYGLTADGKWGSDSLSYAPLGTFITYGISDKMNYIHTSDLMDDGIPKTNHHDFFIEFLLFGTSARVDGIFPPPTVDYLTPESEKEIPPTPAKPVTVTPNLVTFTPAPHKTPIVLPHIPVPEKETYEAAVHPVIVKQTPANIKAVVNEDGVNVNGKLVPKGSTQTWVLTNSPLVAGREVVTSYTMLDPLPAGFEIDREATEAKNTAWTISYDENGKATLLATRATLDYINAKRDQDVTIPLAYFVGRPVNDGGTYKNTFTTLIATPKGEYKVVSNIPVIYTPGNDPETPRTPETPNGENPTPDDNLIQPKKDVVDEKGNSINGQSVLPNTVLNYVAEQDFDQYKGIVASKHAIGKGFLYVDDYLDEAIDGTSLVVNSITATNGDDVRELFDMIHVLSKDALDEKLQALIQDSGISPVGEFYLWVAKDPEAFYKAYVQQGLDITRNLSFKIKQDFVGTITNQTFQVDFGNGYYGNIVTNEVPQLVVHKDVLDKDGKSINNGTVQIGDLVTYKLEGWVIPAGRGYDIKEYRFVDLLQHSHDDYQSFAIEAKVDFTLPDGTVIKKGDDLSAYVETVYNAQTGKFETRFKEEFLSQITRDQAFGADGYITVKRIASGEVVNEYTLYVNGNPVISNKVVTNTPEPPKPETPKPQAPAKAQLPNTGDAASYSLSIAGVVTLFTSLLGLRKRKENE
ncbi:SspB-related isopeptide-forming adhesin [Streptococcus suis]